MKRHVGWKIFELTFESKVIYSFYRYFHFISNRVS